MRNSPLYICDEDKEYLEKLSGYIMKREFSPFIVKTVSDRENFDLRKMTEGLILISSSLVGEDIQALDAHRTIILSSGELKIDFAGFTAVNKYQPASAIYEKLLQCQAEREDIVCVNDLGGMRKKLKVIGVYSPINRIGKTIFTEKMCREEGIKAKILYLNMEEFSKGREEGAGLSEVIYYYKQNKVNVIFNIPEIIRHGELFDYILPVRWVFDLKDMTAQDWVEVISNIEQTGIYDCVWIDFDSMPDGIELFERCEKIYVPYTDSEEENRRMVQFEKMLEMMPEYGIQEKIIKVLTGSGLGTCL